MGSQMWEPSALPVNGNSKKWAARAHLNDSRRKLALPLRAIVESVIVDQRRSLRAGKHTPSVSGSLVILELGASVTTHEQAMDIARSLVCIVSEQIKLYEESGGLPYRSSDCSSAMAYSADSTYDVPRGRGNQFIENAHAYTGQP